MNNEKHHKIEEILGSLDGSTRATAPDFFYTRLKARMEKGSEPVKRPWILRPAFALTALVGVLLINAAVIFQKSDNGDQVSMSDTESMQSIAAEYRLNDSNPILFDLNQDK